MAMSCAKNMLTSSCLRTTLNSGLRFRFLQIHRSSSICQGCRTLLSASYINEDTWKQRKKLKANMNELSIELDRKFYDEIQPVASIDLHKFIDNIVDSEDVEIGQGYLFCHRHSIVAPHLRESTRHSWIRGCLDQNRQDLALVTLQDRVNYGMFLDAYTFNILIDSYLKKDDFKGAAQIAIEMMNQEIIDAEEPLTQLLALYACHMYMNTVEISQDEKQNLGMTLADASRGLTSLLGRSYYLLGYAMTGDLRKTSAILSLLHGVYGTEPLIVQQAIDQVKVLFDNQEEKEGEIIKQIQDSIEQLQSEEKISSDSLDSLIPTQLLSLIPQYENNHIVGYAEKLQQWHTEHKEVLAKAEAVPREQALVDKRKRLEELRLELGGLDYVKEIIEEDLEKLQGGQKEGEERIQTSA